MQAGALLVALAGGCAPHASGPAGSPANHSGGSGATSGEHAVWPFWPQRMRVHPLTRLASDPQTGRPIIECRIEFQDDDGQTSKAVGQLTLQVYPDGSMPTGTGALETWNQDLRDLTVNRRQYDDVTRTYLFRLQLTQPLPAGCELRAFFLSADGRRMNAPMRLR